MSNLIDRQAAIDATWFEPNYTDPLNVLTEVRDRLKELPSAQPEIIQCKDCVYWKNDSAPDYHYCYMMDGTRKYDFYCADAERRNK